MQIDIFHPLYFYNQLPLSDKKLKIYRYNYQLHPIYIIYMIRSNTPSTQLIE